MDINTKEAGFKINNDGFYLNILLILKLRGFFYGGSDAKFI